jgi:UDP-N-acetylmuramate--alanine ligase
MYAADEDPIPDANARTVADRIREHGVPVEFVEDEDNINKYLLDVVEPGDLVIFFGGDDFFEMAESFEARLAQQAEATEPADEPEPMEGPLST